MPKLVCTDCQIEMRPHTIDVAAESMSINGPYQLYAADLYHCPACGKKVLAGFGAQPISEHFRPDYASQRIAQGRKLGIIQFWANRNEKKLYEDAGLIPLKNDID